MSAPDTTLASDDLRPSMVRAVVAFVLAGCGFILVWRELGWRVSLGLFLITWAHNMERHADA